MLTIKGTAKKKIISHIYKILQEEVTDNSLDMKQKWELEMNTIISDKNWELSCREGHKITSCPIWREFDWKVRMRFFRTPLITSKSCGTTDQCWRGSGLVGDHTH